MSKLQLWHVAFDKALCTAMVCRSTHLAAMRPWLLLQLALRASAESITVMSYNIRTASRWATVDGGDARAGRTWALRRRSVARTVEISGAAVVGTQEGLGWQCDELVASLGGSWRRVGGGRVGDGSDEDETASVLYDAGAVELLSTGDYWLSPTPSEAGSKAWGAALPRVATWAVFETAGGERFAVVNAHFDHASDEARIRSAALLRDDAAARFHGHRVAFATGDFNALKDDPWFAEITRPTAAGFALVDAWPAAAERTCGACGQATFHDWKGSYAYSKQWLRVASHEESIEIAMAGSRHIDAVFVSKAALEDGAVARARVITDDKRRRAAGGPFASDHYPVAATYEWRASPRGEL